MGIKMEQFTEMINALDSWLWGLPMIVLLLGTHVFMTLRTGFIQRKTFTGIRLSVTKDPDSPGDVSQFQALTTALASTIGTGNIVGVGTAVFMGGPGAVLWCWLTGVFGIATKYAESLIAVKYRVKTADGRMMGGAMYALERGLPWKTFGRVMAVVFALFAMLASFGIGCGTQINAIAEVMENNLPFAFPRIAVGIIFGIITAVVIIGGIKSIAVVCEKLVPFMAAFYVLGCIVILGINADYILPAVKAILTLAFQPGAVAGGLVGGGILADPVHRPGHPRHRHYHLRLLDHPRLVVLRRAGGGISARPQGDPAVQGDLHRYRRARPGARARPCLDHRGCAQRAHGDPEPRGRAAALGRHREGDAPLSREPRRKGYGRDPGCTPLNL